MTKGGKGKGGKQKRKGKNNHTLIKRELIFKEDGQEYGQVLKLLGNCRLDAQCMDGVKRQCIIRGNMRKKVWIANGDIILVGLRDYQDDKADVIHKYSAEEAKNLKIYGELPSDMQLSIDIACMDEMDDGAEIDFDAI
jgi:translation initiation factor 1A